MLQLAVINIVLILLLPATLQLTSGATLADLGIDLSDWKRQVGWGVWSAMIIIPAVIAIQSLAVRVWPSQKHPVELMVMEQFTPRVALLALLSTVLLAPILEEMLFRGVIQRWLCRLFREDRCHPCRRKPSRWTPGNRRWSRGMEEPELRTPLAPGQVPDGLVEDAGRIPGFSAGSNLAIVVTSVLFAAMHLPQWPAPLAILLLSMGLGSLLSADRQPARGDCHAWHVQRIQHGPHDPCGHRAPAPSARAGGPSGCRRREYGGRDRVETGPRRPRVGAGRCPCRRG